MFRVVNLTKKFGNETVVNHVRLTLPKTGDVALIDPNGAGKTTIMRISLSSQLKIFQ